MTFVIALANTKGGTGKTTGTVYVSKALAAHGKVLAVDADPQGSLYEWHTEAAETDTPLPFDVTVGNTPLIKRRIPGSEYYDFVVIDTPPGGPDVLQAVLGIADVILLPVQAAPMDMKRMWATLEAVGDVPAIVLMSNIERNTALARETRAALMADEDVVVFDVEIPHSQEIRKADGKNPTDLHGYGAVVHELLELMKEEEA